MAVENPDDPVHWDGHTMTVQIGDQGAYFDVHCPYANLPVNLPHGAQPACRTSFVREPGVPFGACCVELAYEEYGDDVFEMAPGQLLEVTELPVRVTWRWVPNDGLYVRPLPAGTRVAGFQP